MNGMLITFEGVDGCGKSTQASCLVDRLIIDGYNVKTSREPGSTQFGERVRKLLSDPALDMDSFSELCLYSAARREHTKLVVRPNLQADNIVVLDRFFDSTTAYQGYAGGVPLHLVERLNHIASFGITPDLTFLIDIDPEEGLKKAGMDRIESKHIDYHKKVRAGFLEIARQNLGRFRVIPYIPEGVEVMHNQIYCVAKEEIARRGI